MLVLLRLLSRLVIQLATILSVTKCSTTRRVYFSYTSHLSLLQPCRKHQKYIAQIMLASYLSMPGVLLAQGVTAANTPHAPSFDRAANGVPIVNINKASSKGVSRNEYNGFNVESKGLIFNNATDIVNTQLAGYVDGNSNLNGLSANIILNEVKGNSRSALNGYMEIAGQSAELIIANQNGITCNGCGFINTTRGTLTTGQATFDGAGGLTGFDVSRGDVDISGLGLNAGNVDEVDILARSVSLNGKFWANNATIVTGQNHIDYQDKTITDLKADGPKALGSGISLDVAAIGGMYANRIRLIGTEKGLGVNVAGEIKAVEDMVLDSQGNLLNSGTLSAKTLTASSENISNTGAVLGHEIHITANQLNNTTAQANIQAIDGVTISTQELNNDASAKILSKSGSIKIDAGAVSNQSVIAADRINIKASSLENKTVNGQIFSTGGLDLTLTGHLNNVDGGLVHSDKVLTIDSLGDLVNASGTIEAVGSATIKSQNLTNSGTVLAQDSVLSIMTSGLENQGTVSGNSLVVNAATLDNSTENGKILSSGKLDLTIDGDVTNTDGALVHADTDSTLDAKGDVTNSGTIEAVGSTMIKSQNLTNSGTILAQDRILSIETNKIENQGTLSSNGLVIKAGELDNTTNTAQIVSSDKVDLTIQGEITNTDGALVHADTDLTLDAKGNLTNSGTVEAVGSSSLTTKNLTNSGTILAQDSSLSIETSKIDNQGTISGKGVVINATALDNRTENGKILSSGALGLTIEGDISNSDGALIHADKALTINAKGDLNNSNSIIETLTSAWVNVQNLFNTGTVLAQDESLSVEAVTVDNQGTLSGTGIAIKATELDNTTSTAQIFSSDKLDLTIQGEITNTDGALVHADTDLTLDAKGNLTNSGTVEAVGSPSLTTKNLTNSGTILAQDSSLSIETSKIDNQGTLSGKGVVINATALDNRTENGKILSSGALGLTIEGDISNSDGALIHADKALTINAKGDLNNSNSIIETLTSAWVNVQNLFNTGTVLAQDESLSVEAVAVENQGALTGNGISINANTLTNSGASSQIFSSDSVDLTIDGDVTNTDGALVHAGSDLTLDAKGNVINRATIEAVKSTAIKSQNLTNSGTILAQDRILSIETSKLENQGTLSGNGLVINATELDNTTSTAQIVSSDKVDLTIDGDVTNTDGALVHADTDLILDAKGNVTNSATIEAVESTTVKSQNLSNSGTILAQDSGLSIETNKIDNQGTLSGSGLAIIATTLDNRTENGKILSSDKLDLTIDGDVTNTDGALIHADKALAINAQADLNNSNSIIETLTNAWVNVQNLFNTGTVLAQNESLSIEAVTVENQDILSGNGLVIKAGELDNTTNTAQIVSSDKVDLTIQGEITNTDGALLHSDTDLTLDAKGNLTNSGTIEAVKSTTITSQNLTNSGTVLAQDHGLSIETNTVDNQGTLSGAGIAINAEALDNRTDNGKILSSEALDLTIEGDITNTDGALIHADKALVIDAKGDLSNSESIIETLTAAWVNVQNLFNTGTVLAQDEDLTIEAVTIENQGTLSGNGLVIKAGELDNTTNTAQIVSSDKVDLTIQGEITNTDGALLHSDTDLTLDAKGNLTNSGTIEAVKSTTVKSQNLTNSGTVLAQDSGLSIETNKLENQGTLSGNGLVIKAGELDNTTNTAQIVSSDKVDLIIQDEITNTDGALIHADKALVIDAKGDLSNSESTIETLTAAWVNVQNLFNTGTVLAQDENLTIEAVTIDNQGTLSGNGVAIKAAELDNTTSTAQIFSSDKLDLIIDGDVTNTDGALVHADTDLTIDAKGNVTNSATIEAVESTTVKSQNLSNSGTILAQDSSLLIETNKIENQGTLSGKGVVINATALDNRTENGKILSSGALGLTIEGDISNSDGALIHADKALVIDAKGDLSNSNSIIETLTSAWVNVQNLFNTGTVLAQDESLSVEAVTVDNQGTLSGNGVAIKAAELDNTTSTAQIFSSDKLDLIIDGDVTNTDGALVHADTDLTIDAKGNVTNSATIEAVESTTVKSQNLSNSGTILAQDSSLLIETNKIENQGTLSGNGLVVNAAALDNRTENGKILSSDTLDLTMEGDITNTDGALIHADKALTINAKGDLNNSNSIIETLTTAWVKVQNLFNTGTVLAQDEDLTIEAVTVENQGTLSGNGLVIKAGELDNTTSTAKIVSSDKVDLTIDGDFNNTDSALVHAGSDVKLDAKGNLINSGTIEAVESATVKSLNLTNSDTVLAQNGAFAIETNQVDNQGTLAGNGITINAASLNNTSSTAQIFSSDNVDLNVEGDISNADGALVHADKDLTLDAKDDLTNSGTIEAVESAKAKSANLTNSGTVLAQNSALSIDTNKVDNQGVLAANGIMINAASLDNDTTTAQIFSSDKVDLNVEEDISNTDGALVHAEKGITLDAQGNVTNSGTLEAITSLRTKAKNVFNTGTVLSQDGELTIDTAVVDNQGVLAGNGITINAAELDNTTSTAQIFSSDKLDLIIDGDFNNTDSALVHAGTDVNLDAKGNLTNSGTIEAVESATVKSLDLINSGTVLTQNSALSIDTNKVDNQGVLAGNGITINAAELDNTTSTAQIFSSDKLDLIIDGDFNNADSALVHAGTDVRLDTKGNLTNSGSIEAVTSVWANVKNLFNTGTLLAQNSALSIDTNKVDNQGVLAGKGITINANGLSNSTANAKIFSSDKVELTIDGDFNNADSALVHAGTDVNLDAKGNLTNSGTIEAVESATVKSQNLTNSGTVLAQNNVLSIGTNKVDNQGVLAGNGITINANGLFNRTDNAKIFSSDKVDLIIDGDINNTDGALVHAGTDVRLDAKGNLTNSGTIEAVTSVWAKVKNLFNTGTVLAQNSALSIDTNKVHNQGVLAGNGITINAASLDNKTTNAKIFSSDKVDLTIDGDVNNIDGALVHAGTDVNLDAKGNLTNSGTIEAVTSVWANVKNLLNTGTVLAQNSALSIDTNKVENQGVLAGNGITINAASLDNDTNTAQIFSSDKVDLTIDGDVNNTDGALVHAGSDVNLDVKGNLTNSGSVEAVTSTWAKVKNLFNTGTVLAQNSGLTIDTNKVENQGVLAGNGININAASLDNKTANAKIFSSDKVDLTIDGDINNTDSALVHAGTDVNLVAKGNLTNSGTIEAVTSVLAKVKNLFNTGTLLAQDDGLSIEAETIDNQGALAGNGITINTNALSNSADTAKIFSSDKVNLTVQGNITNTDGALLHADTDLILDTKGDVTNSGTIEAVESATVKSENFTNSGTVLGQNSTLKVDTSQLDNQGVLAGNGITINANGLFNRTDNAKIFSSDKVDLIIDGDINNTDGALVHAGTDVNLDAKGDVTNSGTIEAVTSVWANVKNLFNTGTVLAQNSALSIDTKKVENQGMLAGNGITINAAKLDNTSNTAQIFSSDKVDLNVEGDISNTDGALLHADTDLILDTKGDVTNSGTIEAVESATVKSENFTNSGTVLGQNSTLKVDTNQLDNQGVLAGNGITINANGLFNRTDNAKIFSSDKVDLIIDGDINNTDGALVHAGTDVNLVAKGNLTNSGTIEAVTSVLAKVKNLFNTGTLLAQDDGLSIEAEAIDNQGALAGNGITINTNALSNSSDTAKIFSSSKVDLTIGGDLNNTDGALVYAGTDVNLVAKGNLTNSGTIEAVTSVLAKVKNLFNTGTLLAQDDGLSIEAEAIDNQGALAGNGITINANELSNSTDSGKIFSLDAVTLNTTGDVSNTDSALIHAGTDATITAAADLINSGTIEAVEIATVKSQNLTNSGTVLAQNNALSINTIQVDNQGVLAGNGIDITASELTNESNNAKIFSSDKVDLTIDGDINNTDGALVHAGTDVKLDVKGNLTNSGTIEAVESATIKGQNLTNTSTVMAQNSELTIDTNKVENQGVLAGNGITINTNELSSSTANAKIFSSDNVDLTIQGNMTNTDGALVHAGTDVNLDAEGNVINSGTIEAVESATVKSENFTNSGTVLAQNSELTIDTNKVDNQGVLVGNGITINANGLSNSTASAKIFSSDNVDLTVEGNITNTDGALVNAGTDVILDAKGSVTNSGSIEAVESATVKSENFTNSGTVLAQNSTLKVDTNQLDNQGVLAGNGITINAASLDNDTNTAKIFSSDKVDLTVEGDITNTDGALVHAGTDVNLDAKGDVTNSGTIEAVTSVWAKVKNLFNTGTLLAQNSALSIDTNKVDNQGVLAGNGITINANELSNSTDSAKIFSSDNVDLTVEGNITNTDGALVHAATDVTLDAKDNVTNSGTIEAVESATVKSLDLTNSGTVLAQNSALTIETNKVDNQGALAGNGITINANELSNSTASAKIFSSDKVDLTIDGDINNTDGALVHAGTDVNLDVKEDLTNSGIIEAIASADIKTNNIINKGKLFTQESGLTLDTTYLDNQGTIQGNGLSISADIVDNSTAQGKVYSTNALDLVVDGTVTNKDNALIHGDKTVSITSTRGNLVNTNATIESATNATLNSQNLTNSGTILAQDDTLTIRAQQLDNQGLLGGRNIDIEALLLNNRGNTSQIYANNNVNLKTTEGAITNNSGALIHAGNDLVLNAMGDLINSNATLESATNATFTSRNLSNFVNSTLLAQNGTLTINTDTLDNDGTLIGENINATAAVVNNIESTSNIFATGDLILKATRGNINNINGANIRANGTLTLNADADIINTGSSIESMNAINLLSHNLTNSGNALIRSNDNIITNWNGDFVNYDSKFEAKKDITTSQKNGNLKNTSLGLITAQNGTFGLTLGSLINQGNIGANRVELNTDGVSNIGDNGLIIANEHFDIRSTTDIDNFDGGVLLSLGSGYLQVNNTITNSSAEIEARGGDLIIDARSIVNKRSSVEVGFSSVTEKYVEEGEVKIIDKGQNERRPLITSQKIKTITKTVSTPYVLKNSSEGRIITGGFLEFKGYVNNIYSLISSGGGLAYNDGINNESLIEKEKTLFNGVERTIRIEHAFRFESKSGKSNFRQERRRESTRPFYNENSSSIILMSSVINSSGDITGKGGRLNNFNESSKVDRASLYEIDYNSLGEADGFIDKWEGANEIELNTSASDAYYFNLIPAPVVKITDNIGVKASIDTIATNDSDGVQVAVTETTANTSVSGQTFVNKATGTTNVKATDGIQVAITETSGNTSVSGQTFVNKATGTTNVKTTDGIQVGVKETSANTRVSGQTVVNTATGTANVKATDAIQVAVTETSADTSVSGQTVVNTATGTANVKATDGIQVGVKETSANTSVSDQVFVNTATGTTNVKATDGIQVAVKETSANSSVSGQAVANIATGTTNVKATDGIQVGVKETSANTSVSGQTVANTATGKTNVKASGVDGVQVAEKGSATTVVGSGTTIRAGSSTSPTVKNDASAPGANVIDLAVVAARRDEIFGDNLANDLVSSALFKESDSPEQNYLIETNPLLTNYKSFISSDYMLNKMIGDESGRTGKTTSRLGDGYLEQKLVRDQILSYTGFQTLPNDVDIEATYATLMNNAVEEYQDLGLSTGIELSDEQIAQLKKPIVWMVTETVQTASGPQQALVPKVYFSNTSDMTLRPDGALIAATNINIDAQEGINNSGTMLAKVDLSLKGNSIDNAGTIKAGGNAGLTATTDITNSGTMQAGGTLGLVAGGNITSETSTNVLTYNRGSYSATQTLVGDTATLQGANISLTAGNDITLIGSEVSASDKVFANAGKDFTLASLAVTNSTKDGAHYNQSSTTNQVTSLSGNNIQLSAGNTLTSQGAQINASGDLGLSASNINLFAVTDSKDQYSFVGGGGNSTKKRSHNESLTGSTLSAGGSLTLVSQQDIFSQGSALSSGEGMTLAAGGDITLAAAEAYNSSFKEVKKKKSGMFGSKRSTKTTTSESLTNLGTSLTSGGDIQMVSGSDILLSGTKASAAGNIGLQAVGGIQLLSAVDQTSSQYQEQKKGSFKVKAKDQGSIKQTAVTSELAGANISLTSGSSIALQGATLSANNTLSMGAATGTLQAVTKDTDGNYINDKGEQVGNVTVGTQALQSSEWSKSSSGFRGIFKDLAKGLAVVAAVGTGGLVHGDIKVGEADATRTDKLTQQTSTLAANNLAIEAQNNLALIGAKVSVADTASLSANDITIDAAHEQTVVTTSHTDETVSGKGATLQKDQISLASITETDQTERTTTTANTWQGSNISAGSLNLSANNNLAILASDINVDSNANIKGENILVGGRDATTDTTHDSITKTKTLDIGIRNSYVDVALATEGLKDAKDSVKEAERNYNDAKQKVADGKIPKEDLDLYQQKLDSAKKSEKLASLAVVNAGVTATLSSATAGFTATAGTSTQVTSNTTTATQSNWSGSTIKVGNNASLNGQNNLTVEGSAISSQGTLEANAKNIDILAGKNTYAETTSSQTKGASASVTASLGVGVSGSVGVNASESNSNSQSTQYSNSSLSAGTLASNSDNLSIKGGNLSGNEVVINTNNLDVISQQATSTSHSESQGKGINLGGSSNSDSVSVSYIQSQTDSDYASVTQQSSITAGDKGYQINVAGNTNLVGGLITSTDKAEASGNNAFSTGTLTQTDLANHAVYSGSSMGVDVGISSNTDSKGNSGLGFSNSMGQGSAGDSRQSTTQSGINTANLAITDADKQQQLTGQSVSQTLADAHTTTSTDTAEANSGVLKNTFNQAEVEQEINQQREVTQAFSKTVQEAKGAITNSINKQKDALNEQLADGKISQTEYDQQNDKLDNYSLLANTISAGLSVPTDSLAGQVAAAASPAVANQIGQYFKGLAADNENGQLNAGQETAHVLAHGILAAAVASAGGNDATTAGIAAAGSEAAAPALAKWLYDKDSSDDLTAAEKQTLTSIMGAASTTVGATTGNVNNAIAAGQAGQNAVENNFLGPQSLEALKKAREKLTVGNANIVVKLDGANQRSDQLLKQYNESPDSLSKSEKEKLGQYLNDYYNELVTEYGVEIAEKLTQNLFSDSPTVSDSALAYNFPYALDSATKTAAADKIRDANNPSVLDYLTGFRDKGENEQTYQKAVGILRVNAVNESNAEVGDTILLVSGIGEIAAATKAAPAFLKGFFGSSDKVVKGLGGVTDTTEIGMRWGKGIQNQGKPFEGYVQKNLPKGTIDLNTVKNNFKTFDHFNPIDGAAYSTKTLDTIGSKTYQNPSKITYTLNNYVKEMANFTEEGAKNGFNLVNSEIKSKTMQLGIPSETSAEQMTAIQKSIDYAAKLPTPINIIVTKVK